LLTDEVQLRDRLLCSKLEALASHDRDYWAFRGNARRDHGHGLMQYPAMMVPQMVSALLSAACNTELELNRIADPFVGSGTVLTEATLRGLDFVGTDINPLAILLCRVKAGPIFPEAMSERSEACIARARRTESTKIDVQFPGRDKWFTKNTQVGLSRIRRAILAEDSLTVRRFLWVALAETVRRTSSSRTSTFKLHIRSTAERRGRRPDPIATFSRIIKDNLIRYRSLGDSLRLNGHLERGYYGGHAKVHLGDTKTDLEKHVENESCDLILTSPPYGDNVTTVPYGQYSYLPLNWINLVDIGPDVDPSCLSTTHEVDRRSLGGSRRISSDRTKQLRDMSPSLTRTLDCLCEEPPDRSQRVVAFTADLADCIPGILRILRPGGLLFWVLGNRKVGGQSIPLDRILSEILARHSCTQVTQIRRRIPSKRMATRNNVASTMANETIIVVRKAVSI
jgi:hypothetical protein